MNQPTTKATNRDLWIIVLIYGLAGLVYFWLFGFLRVNQFDTLSFIKGAQYLFGVDGGAILQQRITKPIPLIFPGLAERMGFSAAPVILFQNTLLFLAAGVLMYKWAVDVYQDRKAGLSAALILLGCQCFALYPLFYLSDIWGYTFVILIGWWGFRLNKQTSSSLWSWLGLGLISACGLLSKESTAMGLLFVVVLIAMAKHSWPFKLQKAGIYLIASLLPVLLIQVILSLALNINIADRVADTNRYAVHYAVGINYLKQIYRILDVHWIWVIIGLVLASRSKVLQKSWYRAVIISGAIFFLAAPFFPYYLVDRILFMIVPLLILVAVGASSRFPQTFTPLIVVGGILNVGVTYFIYRYDTGYLLPIAGLGYLLLVAIGFIYELRRNRSALAQD